MPVRVREPPATDSMRRVPPGPPGTLPSWMTPENTVGKLVPRTTRSLPPRKTLPLLSSEPTVIAAAVRPEISRAPPPFSLMRALPPSAWPLKKIPPSDSIRALPAVLESKKVRMLWLTIVALAAVLEFSKKTDPSLLMCAWPAVLLTLKSVRAPTLLVIAAAPADARSLNFSWPLLVMLTAPALLFPEKVTPPIIAILALAPF